MFVYLRIVLIALLTIELAVATDSSRTVLTESEMRELEELIRPKKHVVAIGVSHFRSNDLWPNLRYSGKDAKDLYSALRLNGSHPFDSGSLLIGDDSSEVTKGSVLQSLASLGKSGLKEEDTVIVYISTHGTVKYREDGSVGRFIIMSDTDPKRVGETALDYQDLLAAFRDLKARKKALILAFCYSGTNNGKGFLTPEMERQASLLKSGEFFTEPEDLLAEGELILSASGWKEPASEDVALQNDIYTHFLLKGLGYDRNKDGAITLLEAHDFATEKTIAHTRGRQRPNIEMKVVGEDPFVIRGQKTRRGQPILYALEGFFRDISVFVNGENFGTLSKGIAVPPGANRVELRSSKNDRLLASVDRVFESGEVYSASEILKAPRPNKWRAGVAVSGFLQDSLRTSLAPRQNFGMQLGFTREQILPGWSLDGSVSYFPAVEEVVEGKLRETGQRVELAQSRTTFHLGVSMLRSALVPFMSSRALGTETRIFAGGGLGLTLFQIRDLSNGQDRFSTSQSEGGSTAVTSAPEIFGEARLHTDYALKGLFSAVGFSAGALHSGSLYQGAQVFSPRALAALHLGYSF